MLKRRKIASHPCIFEGVVLVNGNEQKIHVLCSIRRFKSHHAKYVLSSTQAATIHISMCSLVKTDVLCELISDAKVCV